MERRHRRYILYLVDVFSRFTVGCFIKDKNPDTIVEAILANWVRFFGRMQVLLSDRGGEFLNEDMAKLCEYLDIRHVLLFRCSVNSKQEMLSSV